MPHLQWIRVTQTPLLIYITVRASSACRSQASSQDASAPAPVEILHRERFKRPGCLCRAHHDTSLRQEQERISTALPAAASEISNISVAATTAGALSNFTRRW